MYESECILYSSVTSKLMNHSLHHIYFLNAFILKVGTRIFLEENTKVNRIHFVPSSPPPTPHHQITVIKNRVVPEGIDNRYQIFMPTIWFRTLTFNFYEYSQPREFHPQSVLQMSLHSHFSQRRLLFNLK